MENRHLIWGIIRIGRGHRRLLEKEITNLGIHPSQHHILMYLAGNGASTQCSIAQAMEVSAATIAVSLKKLEKGKYVEKKTSEEDNRVNFIVLTKKGEEVVRKSQQLFEDTDEALFRGLTEEEKKQFYGFLEHMIQNLKVMEEK